MILDTLAPCGHLGSVDHFLHVRKLDLVVNVCVVQSGFKAVRDVGGHTNVDAPPFSSRGRKVQFHGLAEVVEKMALGLILDGHAVHLSFRVITVGYVSVFNFTIAPA
jgi:hypothetical protein